MSLAARAAVAATFVAAVLAVLGPSLVGERVALPHDLHLQQLPWSSLPAADEPHNTELRDLVDQYYPTQHAIVRRLRAGADATWLPDVSFGFPGWEFVGWGAVSPFTLLPALVAPFDLAWSWGQGLRLLTAMAGAFLLTRSLGAGRAGGVLAGLAFGLSGFVVGWLGWPQSHVAALLPWVWWAVERTAGPRVRWWGAPALAVTTAALWLGGFPAVSVYGLLAAGLVALSAAARSARPLWRLAAAAAGVAAGTALAAFTLLPTVLVLDELDLTARADAWRSRVFPIALWQLAAPRLFGGAPTEVPRWIGQASVESTAFVGVVTLALAAAAWALGPRRRGVALHTAMAFGFGLLAYGAPPLLWLIQQVPPLATNPPNRVLAVVCLSAAVAGGLGLDAVSRWLRGAAVPRPVGAVVAAAVVAAFAVWGAWEVAGGAFAAHADRYLADAAEVAAARSLALRALGWAAAVVAAAAAAVALGWWRHRRGAQPATLVVAAVLALAAADLLVGAIGWNTQVPRRPLFPDAPGLAELRAVEGRVAGAEHAGDPSTHLEHGFDDLRAHAFVTPRQRAALDAAGARFLSPTRWTLDRDRAAAWPTWLSATGVHAVLVPAGADVPGGWARRQRGPVDVAVNPAPRPPVAALVDVAAAPLDGDVLAEVGARDPAAAATQAVIEPPDEPAPPVPALPDADGAAEVRRWSRDGGRLTATVTSDAGALLVTDQAALPGWRATVDGDPAAVVTVDGLLAGVVLDPGEHEVTLHHVAPGRTAGRLLTGSGLVAMLLLGAAGWSRREPRLRELGPGQPRLSDAAPERR